MSPMEPPLDIKFVEPDRTRLVVVERTRLGEQPEYCVHGRTKCMLCGHWCWLGSETHQIVSSGGASPVCLQCATDKVDLTPQQRVARVQDHR